jgi:Ni/Co efflux regulator RcnB
MKPLISVAVALAFAAGAAHAQSGQDQNGHKRPNQAATHTQAPPPQNGARTGARGGWNGGTHGAGAYTPAYRGAVTGPVPGYRGQGQPGYAGQNGAYRGGTQSFTQGGRTFRSGSGVGRAINNTGTRGLRAQDRGRRSFAQGGYQRSYQSQRRFDAGRYLGPRGWYYRRWGFGDYLPLGWYVSSYYLNAWDYGLPPPPIGAEWVRNGPDAVLVDIWTGEVLSVDYGVFY